jgi:ParB-like chromosome segregation protein Spo0J
MAARFPRYRVAKVDDLMAYENNPRTHSDAQVAKLAASIARFGFTNPVLTDGDDGVIAGHGRLLAARKLGLETVPVIELKHLTAAERRAYVIADNKLALDAGWDDDLLRIELGALRVDGFDLDLTGFEGLEIDKLFAEDPDADAGADDAEGQLDGKVCCPSCGHEFQTVNKAFRLIAARK